MLQLLQFIPLAQVTKVAYMLPLIVAISLVYGATRHEDMHNILRRATRVGAWISVFLVLIFLGLQLVSMRL